MEEYINNYNNFNESYVYDFKVGYGGIGDYIKYFMVMLTHCMRNNIKVYHKINNIEIEKYIKLKHDFLYVTAYDISKMEDVTIKIPKNYYYNPKQEYRYDISVSEVFKFDDSVKQNVKHILSYQPLCDSEQLLAPTNYISMHLRLGDKYLETKKRYISCLGDERRYSEEKMYKFIEDNCDKTIIFFSDNNSYKLKIKERYNDILITNSHIGHSSFRNTTGKQILDAVTELYLLTESQLIYMASESGFSRIASLFNNVKCVTQN
tara:strand:+ start:260 stop:1048 length:789 start_codon:yes stop_codon:yes gene_type:complete